MLTRQERAKLLEELEKSATKMTDEDLIATVGFVKASVKENPRRDPHLTLVCPAPPLIARH